MQHHHPTLRTMPFFWKPYQSDATALIESLRAAKPTLQSEQRAGRALLWEPEINREAQAQQRLARVAQQPYVYQNKG